MSCTTLRNVETMRFPYSVGGKPLLPIRLSLGGKDLAAEALLDSGADVNVLPWRVGEAWVLNGTSARRHFDSPARSPAHPQNRCC